MQSQQQQYELDLRDIIPRTDKAKDYPTYRLDRCLWHEDNNPSLLIYSDGYQCQSAQCGARGSIRHYLETHGEPNVRLVSQQHAARLSATRREAKRLADYPIDLGTVLALANHHTKESLEWLANRGISEEMCDKWLIGWDPFKREICIPIIQNREIWNIRRRPIDPEPSSKYKNWVIYEQGDDGESIQISWGSVRLFNVDSLAGQSTCIVSEGEFDAIVTQERTGIPVVSSTSGSTSWQSEWNDQFRAVRRVYLVPDLDRAGLEGAIKAAGILGNARCSLVRLPDGLGHKGDLSDYWARFTRLDFLTLLTTSVPVTSITPTHQIWSYYQ